MPRGARDHPALPGGSHRRGLLRHRRRRTRARVDRQGWLRGGRGLERHLLRHGLRRQRAFTRPSRSATSSRPSADHPHGHLEHAHPRHRVSREPTSPRPAADDRVPHGLRRRRRRRAARPPCRSSSRRPIRTALGRRALCVGSTCGPRSRPRWRPRPTARRARRRGPCCASSRLQRTSTGAARCTAASSCGGSTRLPTCSRPAGRAGRQCRRLLRRGALLPSAAHRTPGRGRGALAAHRHLEHAHQRARSLRRPCRRWSS